MCPWVSTQLYLSSKDQQLENSTCQWCDGIVPDMQETQQIWQVSVMFHEHMRFVFIGKCDPCPRHIMFVEAKLLDSQMSLVANVCLSVYCLPDSFVLLPIQSHSLYLPQNCYLPSDPCIDLPRFNLRFQRRFKKTMRYRKDGFLKQAPWDPGPCGALAPL